MYNNFQIKHNNNTSEEDGRGRFLRKLNIQKNISLCINFMK